MDYAETIAKAQDAVTVRRVYGEPYERNGVTVIPAAQVAGGGGAGGGEDPNGGGGGGGGGGFGIAARPVGAYVIRGDEVKWRPAVDLSRVLAQLTPYWAWRYCYAARATESRHHRPPLPPCGWALDRRELVLHPASSSPRSDPSPGAADAGTRE